MDNYYVAEKDEIIDVLDIHALADLSIELNKNKNTILSCNQVLESYMEDNQHHNLYPVYDSVKNTSMFNLTVSLHLAKNQYDKTEKTPEDEAKFDRVFDVYLSALAYNHIEHSNIVVKKKNGL